MAVKQRFCPVCGAEIHDLKADICPRCGEGLKRPFYKRMWFLAAAGIILLVLVAAIAIQEVTVFDGMREPDEVLVPDGTVSYAEVNLQTLFHELDTNAPAQGSGIRISMCSLKEGSSFWTATEPIYA